MQAQHGSKVRHTPGPWEVKPEEVDKDYIRIRGSALGARYKVANVLTPTHLGVLPEDAAETRANARLIGKAPEMFELIKTITRLADGSHCCGHLILDQNSPLFLVAKEIIALVEGGAA